MHKLLTFTQKGVFEYSHPADSVNFIFHKNFYRRLPGRRIWNNQHELAINKTARSTRNAKHSFHLSFFSYKTLRVQEFRINCKFCGREQYVLNLAPDSSLRRTQPRTKLKLRDYNGRVYRARLISLTNFCLIKIFLSWQKTGPLRT